MRMHLCLGLLALCSAATLSSIATAGTTLYVAANGNDRWSGRSAEPNADKTDGPFATLHRARDEIRKLKAAGQLKEGATVLVRGGTYFLSEPLVLGPQDSSTKEHPITYRACPGEKVVLSGGRRIPGPWKSDDGKIHRTHLPDVQAGKWYFRQLRVGAERRMRARFPNFDPDNPWLGGFSHVASAGFQTGLGCVQEPGTWLEYDVDVPADGEYAVRVYYANNGQTNMRFFKSTDMSGRTTLAIDGGEPIPLADLTDTGSFYGGFRWSRSGTVRLTKGKHVLRWTNVKGGGLSLLAFMLCTDPDFTPPAPGSAPAKGHAMIVQAEKYDRKHGDLVRQMIFVDRFNPVFRTNFPFEPGALKSWPRSPDAEIFVIPEYDWVSEIVRLVSVDEANRTARVEGANATKPFMPGNRFCAMNVLEELDTPGEWCLVRKTGMLYYLPKEKDFTKQEVVAPHLDRVIELHGDKDDPVRHVNIEGFTISDTRFTAPERVKDTYHADDAAVWLWAAQHCRIAGNVFRDVGGYGVMLRDASTHNQIVDNEIVGAGQGGIYLNGFADVPRKRAADGQRPAHNVVAHNHVHHCGWFYVHVAGVYLACADDNLIAHNDIHDMTRYGISLKQNCPGNVVEYNDVRRTNLATRDTGAIEMAGNKAGSIVRYNIVGDSVGCGFDHSAGEQRMPQDSCGIYLDNMSSKVRVTGNIVFRNAGGVWLNWGSDNVIENNIFVESRDRQIVFNIWHDKKKWHTKGNRFTRNIVYYTDPAVPLYQVGGWNSGRESVQSDYNLIYAAGKRPVIKGVKADDTWAAWRKAGQDTHSVAADPCFVAPEKDDYRLKPDSPAFKLGFERIPVEKIGRKKG